MTVGEIILKANDLPFAYSFIAILLGYLGHEFGTVEQQVSFLGLAGFLGTFLTIVDPLGKGVRRNLEKYLQKRKEGENEQGKEILGYAKSVVKRKAIDLEIEKVVGFIYFATVVAAFSIAVLNSEAYARSFVLNTEITSCDIDCVRIFVEGGGIFTLFILLIIAFKKNNEIRHRTYIAAIHQYSLKSNIATTSTVESLGEYIEQGDWEMAQKVGDLVLQEIEEEESLKPERSDKINKHIDQLLEKFSIHYTSLKAESKAALYTSMGTEKFDYTYRTSKEIVESFAMYESLVSHLYTDKENGIYDLILEISDVESKIDDVHNEITKVEKDMFERIQSVDIQADEVTAVFWRNSNTGETIGISDLKEHLMKFAADKDTPIVDREASSELSKVSLYPAIPVAHLRKENVTDFVKILEECANKIKPLYSRLNQSNKEKFEIDKKVELGFNKMLDMRQLALDPLTGACEFCINRKLRSERELQKYKDLLSQIPWDTLKVANKMH